MVQRERIVLERHWQINGGLGIRDNVARIVQAAQLQQVLGGSSCELLRAPLLYPVQILHPVPPLDDRGRILGHFLPSGHLAAIGIPLECVRASRRDKYGTFWRNLPNVPAQILPIRQLLLRRSDLCVRAWDRMTNIRPRPRGQMRRDQHDGDHQPISGPAPPLRSRSGDRHRRHQRHGGRQDHVRQSKPIDSQQPRRK